MQKITLFGADSNRKTKSEKDMNNTNNKLISFLSFSLGKEIFAIEVKNVLSIIEPKTITKVPQSHDYLIGMINLRGEALPLIDLQVKIAKTKTVITKESCILVIQNEQDGEEIKLGVLVDAVHDVLEINESEINEPPRIGVKKAAAYIKGSWQQNDRFILLMNLKQALFTEDLEKINILEDTLI